MIPKQEQRTTSPEAQRPSRRFFPQQRKGGGAGERVGIEAWQLTAIALALATLLGVLGAVLRRPAIPDPARIGTVEPFSLKDAQGRTHDLDEWRDARAVVIFVLGTACQAANEYAPEMRRLAEGYRSQGVLFLGVQPDPAESERSAQEHAGSFGLPFPVLLDPAQELTGDLGVRVTPESAVLDPQGHLLYRGRIDDRNDSEGRKTEPHRRDLEDSIRAVLAGNLPATERTEAFGSPLPAPRPLIASDELITFNAHVAPILWNRCAGCHRPGEVGPFSLLTYRDAAKRAEFLSEVATSRQMPPWHAVYGYGDFHDTGRLSRRELAVLARWAETGAPEGEPADRKTPPEYPSGWQLGQPDRVLTMPEPFDIPADNGDIYRAFVIPMPDVDAGIAAVEFRPGNRHVVHHARFFTDPTDDCRRRDAADPLPGFLSAGGGGDILKPGLGAWVPGLIPRMPPSDVGTLVGKGSDLVMLIHYHGSGKQERDQSSLGLFYCKKPPGRRITSISMSTDKIDIPAGEKRHRIALRTTLKSDVHAVSVLPHGHYLLSEISMTATLPSGRVVPLLWIDQWDFNWQGQYHFARPVALPKGTRLDVVAYYDNSPENPSNPSHPPKRVKFGLWSRDEMLGCHLQVIADDAESQRVLNKVSPFGL